MATKANKQSTAASKERARIRDYKRGIAGGREWVATCDPFDALEFVNSIGWDVEWSSRAPWTKCPFPDLRKRLRSEGRDYTHTFIQAVQDDFKAQHAALVSHRHQEGIVDGRLWTSDYAAVGQLAHVEDFAWSFMTRGIFIGPEPYEPWTPAHRLVTCLMGDAYPHDKEKYPLVDCREFREFWQPFVNEPMDTVMSNLKLYGFRAGHKLQDRHYIAGFVDGALGLSEQLGRRLSERTLPPKDGSNRGE